jgi:hypothetical protein
VRWRLEKKIRSKIQNSKTHNDTKSVINFESKCAPVSRIHVSFAFNQHLASCRVTVTSYDSAMQSGGLITITENWKQILKTQ